MRKRLLVIFFLILLGGLSLNFSIGKAAYGNIEFFTNGGFELGNLTGWTFDSGTATTGDKHSGTYSGVINGGAKTCEQIFNISYPSVNASRYAYKEEVTTFEFWSNTAGGAWFRIIYNALNYTTQGSVNRTGGGWVRTDILIHTLWLNNVPTNATIEGIEIVTALLNFWGDDFSLEATIVAPPPPPYDRSAGYNIRYIFGLVGLAIMVIAPTYSIWEIKKNKNYMAIISAFVLVCIGYAFVLVWLTP